MSFETYHGVVYPAQTDAMGHMTVQYYVAAFDQAMWHLVANIGYNPEWRAEKSEGWADVRYEIDYRSELKLGELYVVSSSVVELGRTSLKSRHKMSRHGGQIVAELLMTSVYFDLAERKSKPLPSIIRERCQNLLDGLSKEELTS
jgi:acyl-CoA thioester hydrolase